MSVVKKVTAAIVSLVMVFAFVGCGNTTWALKVGDYQVKAGVYIYYMVSAYYEAINKLSTEGKVDTKDEKALKNSTIEGKDFKQWVQDSATENVVNMVTVTKKFDEMKLSFTDDEITEMDTKVEQMWEANSKLLEKNGVGHDSFEDAIVASYKDNAIFKAYYGVDGIKGVKEDELQKYYIDNYARIKYIEMPLKDGAGNILKSDGKAKVKEMAEDYVKRVNNGESMDDMIDEYAKYSQSVSEEAAATATNESGETIGTLATTTEETTTTEKTTTTTEKTTTTKEEATTPDETDTISSDSSSTLESKDKTSDTTVEETTTAPEETGKTTESTNPFPNEKLVAKVVVTTADSKEAESNAAAVTTTEQAYQPSKKSNEAIFADNVKENVAFLVEEDEAYYVIVKLSLKERMNANDLWGETQIDAVENKIYGDEYDKIVKELTKQYEVVKNEKAYKRYDPFEAQLDSES